MPTEALCIAGARLLLLVGHQECEFGTWREREPPDLGAGRAPSGRASDLHYGSPSYGRLTRSRLSLGNFTAVLDRDKDHEDMIVCHYTLKLAFAKVFLPSVDLAVS